MTDAAVRSSSAYAGAVESVVKHKLAREGGAGTF